MIDYVSIVENNYNKLIVITNKEILNRVNYKSINLNIDLTEMLLDYPMCKRAIKVADLTQDIINKYDDKAIIVTGIEILFTKHLNVSCIDLFKANSRNITLIIDWPGEYVGDTLIYAKGHIEEFKYKVNNEFIVVGGE